MSTVLSLESATFRYEGRTEAVGPFAFDLHEGEAALVSGPSGSGKSTFARLCCGVIPHLYRGTLRGAVRVRGRATLERPLWRLVEDVGLVAQNPEAQLVASTVRGEIAFGLSSLRLDTKEAAARVDEAIAWAQLEDRADEDPRRLSGGEQQRLVIASCVARRPAALVLDEPLSMLDDAAVDRVVEMLAGLPDRGACAVTFEHRTGALERLPRLRRYATGATRPTPATPLPDPPRFAPGFRVEARGLASQSRRAILAGVDLDLEGGTVVALVGPNGSGKTTLLRALAGLDPVRGRLRVEADRGTPPRIGLVFQNPDRQIFNGSVRDEILCGCARPDEGRYRRIVDALGLSTLEQRPPLLLSEGEKKRLGLATLLVHPDVGGVLLDEPTLGQDAGHRRLLGRIVRWLADAGAVVVVATHDREWVSQWADRIVGLRDGAVVEDRRVTVLGPSLDVTPAEVA